MTEEERQALDRLENGTGFFHYNNYHIDTISNDKIILRVDLDENSLNPYGIVHGAVIFGLGDNLMGLLAVQAGRSAVTLSNNISYLKPGDGKYLKAEGEVLRSGKTICFVKASIYNDRDELIAIMDGTYHFI